MPLGAASLERYGAPYWVVHRADLQAALAAEAMAHPDVELRLGCQFEDVAAHAKGLTVVHRRGDERRQDVALALIGADGVWSAVRHHLFPQVRAEFSGLIAWNWFSTGVVNGTSSLLDRRLSCSSRASR